MVCVLLVMYVFLVINDVCVISDVLLVISVEVIRDACVT